MGSRAGLNRHHARRKTGEERQQPPRPNFLRNTTSPEASAPCDPYQTFTTSGAGLSRGCCHRSDGRRLLASISPTIVGAPLTCSNSDRNPSTHGDLGMPCRGMRIRWSSSNSKVMAATRPPSVRSRWEAGCSDFSWRGSRADQPRATADWHSEARSHGSRPGRSCAGRSDET